tara:strand:+ start:3833 stop:4180 length:348 start_codon:yes stop_codon:yes gene_type:complete
MPKLTTALLNESIDIERYSSTQSLDDRGNINHTWSSNATSVQARVTEARDQSETQDEFLQANTRRVRVIIPSTTDVTVRDRVSYDSIKWDIKGVKNVKDRFGNSFYKQLILESGY